MYDGLANTYILVQSCEASIYDPVMFMYSMYILIIAGISGVDFQHFVRASKVIEFLSTIYPEALSHEQEYLKN